MMRSDSLRGAACLLILLLATPAAWGESERHAANPFPTPAGLEPDVRFWTRVYTEVDTGSGLLHDSRNLAAVYEVIDVPRGVARRSRERHIEKRKDKYRAILRKLGRGVRTGLSAEEKRVLGLFPSGVKNETLRASARRVRFQLGQADKFRAGVIRSGAYEAHIGKTLAEMGLPAQIAALPHVESSYTPHAYSRVGAAGLWQFTRSTGRRFMRVDHVVDERLDPYLATVSAARLLEQNHRVTGAWPLAITAYNHGASGMRRAVRKLGTRDIERIVREYKSRTFGFASRNFYVEFIAASRIAEAPERYFGHLVRDQPIQFEHLEMPFYGTPGTIAKALGVPVSTLKAANPALRSSVWQGQKRIPRGFSLKVPRAELPQPMQVALADVPKQHRHAKQTRDAYHVVRRGDTLSGIARRYGVRVSELQALNGLRSRHRIRAGQKLRLPGDHVSPKQVAAVRPSRVEPEPPPADGRYTVSRGDTIHDIARRFGMTERDLAAVNGLRNRHRIYPGQVLRVAANDAALLGGSNTPAKGDANGTKSARSDAHPQALAELTPAATASAEPVVTPPPSEESAATEGPIVAVAAALGDGETEPSDPAALLADPNDYSVASNGTIEVQAMETLGHYAEWLGLRASRLRSINHLEYGEPLPVHSRLKLDFGRTTPGDFEDQRLDYHKGIQEEFFSEWEISGTESHRLRRGDSLWMLSHRRFNVPLWLLRQYNPDVDFESPTAGTAITVPLLKRREWLDGAQNASRPARGDVS